MSKVGKKSDFLAQFPQWDSSPAPCPVGCSDRLVFFVMMWHFPGSPERGGVGAGQVNGVPHDSRRGEAAPSTDVSQAAEPRSIP